MLLSFYTSKITYAAEATIDSAITTTTGVQKLKSNLVFINANTGYMFYVDSTGVLSYSKTTDGGGSWGAAVATTAQADIALYTVWYDQWTPGDAGTKVHIAMVDTGNDDVWYDTFDTSGDSNGSEVAMDTSSGNSFTNADNLSISKGTNGNFYIGFCNGALAASCTIKRCTGTCTTAGNWVAPGTSPIDVANDPITIQPLASGDMLLIRDDISADDIQSKKYTVGTTTWDASWTNIDTTAVESATYMETVVAAVDKTTNAVYLAYGASVAGAGTADIRTATYSGGSWALKTDVLTDANTIIALDIATDALSGDIYVAYLKGTAGSSCNAFYKKSINGMSTWGTETQFNTTGNDLRYIYMNKNTSTKLYGVYYQNATNDGLFGDTIVDLSAIDLTWITDGAYYNIYQSGTLTWGTGTLACSGTLTDTNANTINCLSGAGINASTQYRVDVLLKNNGGTTAKMNGASDFVDNVAVKAQWAGTSPTLGSCGFYDPSSDNGSTSCTLAFNATNDVRITNTGAGNVNLQAGETEGYMYTITTDSSVPTGNANSYMSSTLDSNSQTSSKVRVSPIASVSISDGVVTFGTVAANGSVDTTSTGLNDTQTATNNGDIISDLNIKGQNSANWTLGGNPGSDIYSHDFCKTGGGSPDPCDASPTWTALTTNYQTLVTALAVSGTQKFDLRLRSPTATSSYSQQSVDIVVQAVAN